MKFYTYRPLEAARDKKSVLGAFHGRPRHQVPANACDCHVHVFGPPEQYPLAEDRTFSPGVASVADLVAMHQQIGIERTVIVQASPQGADNSGVLDALAQLGRLGRQARAVAVVGTDTAMSELLDLHAAGVRGLRVNLQSYGQADPAVAAQRMTRAAYQAAELGWHVQTYTTLDVIAALSDTIRTLPVPLVVDHFGLADADQGPGQPGFMELLELVGQGSVYVKLSAPYRIISQVDGADAKPLARALIDANSERMLWGTDWPHTGQWPGIMRDRDRVDPFHPVDDGAQLDILGTWTSASERQQILVNNPAKLYGF